MRVFALVLALASISSIASADAIGGPCPSGQIYRANPVQPGAMHHGGGQCVPDPSASHCSAAPGRAHGPSLSLALLGLAVAVGRRVRVRAR